MIIATAAIESESLKIIQIGRAKPGRACTNPGGDIAIRRDENHSRGNGEGAVIQYETVLPRAGIKAWA